MNKKEIYAIMEKVRNIDLEEAIRVQEAELNSDIRQGITPIYKEIFEKNGFKITGENFPYLYFAFHEYYKTTPQFYTEEKYQKYRLAARQWIEYVDKKIDKNKNYKIIMEQNSDSHYLNRKQMLSALRQLSKVDIDDVLEWAHSEGYETLMLNDIQIYVIWILRNQEEWEKYFGKN